VEPVFVSETAVPTQAAAVLAAFFHFTAARTKRKLAITQAQYYWDANRKEIVVYDCYIVRAEADAAMFNQFVVNHNKGCRTGACALLKLLPLLPLPPAK
jgi:hypothetical protein